MSVRTLQRGVAYLQQEEAALARKLQQRKRVRETRTPRRELPKAVNTFFGTVTAKLAYAFNTDGKGEGAALIILRKAVAQDVFDAVIAKFRNAGWTVEYTFDCEESLAGPINVFDSMTFTPPSDWLNRILPE